MATIITKNSSTASATPAAGDLTKGELAVNVTDKKLYTKDNSSTVVRIVGSLGNQEASAAAITGGTVAGVAQTGGTINNTPIGGTTAAAVTGTVVTATTNFVGALTGAVTGNTTGTHTGDVTGNVTGNLTGNVTASTGTSSFNDVTINGGLNMNAGTSATITNLTSPTNSGDAATKGYVDTAISNLVDGAPAALDTLNELAAALNDDASFSTTVTNSIAAKLPLAGGTMSGAIAMGTSKITGLGTPTANTDAATKGYVDTAASSGLPLSGGTMTGNIVMGANKVTSTATPTTDDDLTRKAYVDSILGSATSAATSASNAATSETNAANSASAASSSASAASASASSAAASYDSFDDRYLGPKSSAPTVDNDGNALLTGALYWNTTVSTLYVWTGSAWTQAAFTASGFASTGSSNTFTANQIVSVTDNTNAALRITQLGTGNALLVEDSANPDATPFVVDANGRVIIGSTSATGSYAFGANAALQLQNTYSVFSQYSANTSGNVLDFVKSRSATIGTQSVVSSGDILGGFYASGSDGTAFIPAAQVLAAVDGTPGTNDMPGRLMFSTTADGASSPTERMRINSAGNVLVGGTAARGTTAGTSHLDLFNGTAPAGTLTNGVSLYSDSGDLKFMNAAGDAFDVGYRNIPQNSQSANYTLTLADAGKHIFHPSGDANARTFTIPANSSVAYPIGTAITFINMTAAVVTIAITTDTMYLSSAGTTGSRSLARYGSATAIKIDSTSWLISGSGLT